MIAIDGLAATMGAFQLQSVSLEVPSGELMVLLGPSGAGKTVFLESVIGLLPISAGRITIDGRDVTHLPPEARNIAYMPQDVALFPHLSVLDNILFGRRVRGTLAGAQADLERLTEMLEIGHLLDRRSVQSLSGGEKQRVALARALITDPSVLFLDESFSALDAHIRRRLLVELRELQRALSLTAVYITHSQGEASLVGDHVAVLMAGRVVQVARPGELFRQPASLAVARFLQLGNLFLVDSVDATSCQVAGLALALAGAPAPHAGPVWLGIAAEDILVLHPGEGDALGLRENRFPGRVVAIEIGHPRSRLRVAVAGPGQPVASTARASSEGGDHGADLVLSCELGARDRVVVGRALAVDDPVEVYLPPQALSIFPEQGS